MGEIVHILSHFDSSDFKDHDIELWKSKYYNDTIVLFYDDMYITMEKVMYIANNGKKVKMSDMSKF